MSENHISAKRLGGAAAILMVAGLVSRFTGYLRTVLIYSLMSPKGYSDQFLLAFTLPDLMFELLAGGAISAAFVPILASYLSKGKEKTGWIAISTFMNASCIFLAVLEVVCLVFTGPLLGLLAPGYHARSEADRLMVIQLTRILLMVTPFMMMAGQINGVLNSYKRFTASALGPVVYNIFSILSISLFGAKSAQWTAWGVVGSAGAFFLMQLYSARDQLRMYRPRLQLTHPAFRELYLLAIPSLLASTIMEVNNVISRGNATFLSENMLTLLNNANRTWQLPLGIIAQSIGIALLPTLSSMYAESRMDDFKKLFYRGLRAILTMSLPVSMLLIALDQDIMRVLFKWGSRPEEHVFWMGIALIGYATALIFASVLSISSRAFYAQHNTVVPLLTGLCGIAANLLFNTLFRNYGNLGIAAPALAYSCAVAVNMSIQLIILQRKTGFNIIRDNARHILRVALAGLPAAWIAWGVSHVLPPHADGKVVQLICLALAGGAGLLVFYGLARLFHIREVESLTDVVRQRFSRLGAARR